MIGMSTQGSTHISPIHLQVLTLSRYSQVEVGTSDRLPNPQIL
jgi:hypothetical protein